MVVWVYDGEMSWARMRTAMVSVLVVAVVTAGVCVGYARTRPVVRVTQAMRGPVVQAFYSTGTVSAVREYPVRAQVGGVVTELKVDKGSVVAKGDLIAVVRDPTLEFLVARARAELKEKVALADEGTSPVLAEIDAQAVAVSAVLEIAQRELVRVERMKKSEATTSVDLDRSMDRVKTLTSEKASLVARRETKLLELRRMLEVSEAALNAAEAESEKQNVRAPAAGVVLDRPMPFGTRVDETMNNHLMTIADVSQDALVMRAQVDEEDVAGLHEGQEVKMTLYAYGGELFRGKVARIYDKADAERRTFEVDVTVDRRGNRIAAGMTGELAFVLAERAEALVIPSEAVQQRIRRREEGEARRSGEVHSAAGSDVVDEMRETVVWTVREGRLVPVAVKLGLRGTERVEVLEGLSMEDEVVVSAVDGRTKAGTAVRTERVARVVAAGATGVAKGGG